MTYGAIALSPRRDVNARLVRKYGIAQGDRADQVRRYDQEAASIGYGDPLL